MKRLAAVTCAVALAALPAAARADLFSSVSYGVHASTIGDGITLEKPLLYDFSVRVTANSLSVSQQQTYDGVPYTATSRFRNYGVIGDFRPYAGRYRLSAGLLFGNDAIENTSHSDVPQIRVGSALYPTAGAGTVTTRLRFDRPSIYLGAGTGTGLVRGLALAFDAGILIRNGHTQASASGPLAATPAFQADLERLRNELRPRTITPVVSVGVVFRP